MANSALVTPELVQEAIALARPSIDALLQSEGIRRPFVHVVVLDPRANGTGYISTTQIVHEQDIGETENPEKYKEFAHGKARISLDTGKSSHEVVAMFPHLLEWSDVKYGGSVVLNGIIVAASGVQWQYDLLIATWIGAAIYSLVLLKMQEISQNDGVDRVPDRPESSNPPRRVGGGWP